MQKKPQLGWIECSITVRVKSIEVLFKLRPGFVWGNLAVAVSVRSSEDQIDPLVTAARPSRDDVRRFAPQQQTQERVIVEAIALAVSLPEGDHLEGGTTYMRHLPAPRAAKSSAWPPR